MEQALNQYLDKLEMVYIRIHIFQFILNYNEKEILYNLLLNYLHKFFLLIKDKDFQLLLQSLILEVFLLSYLYLFLSLQAIAMLSKLKIKIFKIY